MGGATEGANRSVCYKLTGMEVIREADKLGITRGSDRGDALRGAGNLGT